MREMSLENRHAKNVITGFQKWGMSLLGLTAGVIGSHKKKCTHMGCRLQGNPCEKTKDCPCHGSRFGLAGNLPDGPANRGLKGCNGEEMQLDSAGTNGPWSTL